YEIGYKHHGDQHQLDLAVYYMTINDTIISQEISDDLNININAGKTIHTGIELSLASQWTKEWATQIAY
ncbi:MAG TPA: hypothetical protein DCS49_00510, partial [Gammaproteobacteria bacterium]|nr:hypothetical protein [Gammaproteobacteria bacterium]